MSVFTRYVLNQFILRTVLITMALAFILLAFDLLGNAVEIMEQNGHGLRPVVAYAILRFPAILALVIPLGTLLGAMVTLSRLVTFHEMVAFIAAGGTIYRVVGIFMMGAIPPVLLHFLLISTTVPHVTARLAAWQKNNYVGMPGDTRIAALPGWFLAEPYLIQVNDANEDGTMLYGVRVVKHDHDTAMLTYFYHADEAVYESESGQWYLRNANTRNLDNSAEKEEDGVNVTLDLGLKPKDVARGYNQVSDLSLLRIWHILHSKETTSQPTYVYRLWLQQKFAEPMKSFAMILLACPLGLQLARRNSLFSKSFISISGGLLYYIVERILLSLGETDVLPVLMAIWAPFAIFTLFGWWLLLEKQE